MVPRHALRAGLRSFVVLAALAVGSCTGGTSAGSLQPGSRDTITEEELGPIAQLSAYEAIERLRPRWFQTRTGRFPMVHVDGTTRGSAEELLPSIPCAEVQEMRYMTASDATTRFGTDYTDGVILITTKK